MDRSAILRLRPGRILAHGHSTGSGAESALGDGGGGYSEGMVSRRAIREFAGRIVEEYQPEKVILFGSYAYGTPRPESDVDLLAIMPFEGNSIHQAGEMVGKLNPPFFVDLVLRTGEQVRQRLEWNDFFLREIIERGKVLHAATDR